MSGLLDLKEAAARLAVSYTTAREYIARGLLRAVRLPSLERPGQLRRVIQVREEDLEEFIRSALTIPVDPPAIAAPEPAADTGVPQKKRRNTQKGQPYEWCGGRPVSPELDENSERRFPNGS